MAILEKIRSRSLFLILVIGLALFAFVISGVFTSNDMASQSAIGEVNGDPISREDFALKVESASRRFGPGASTVQVVNQVWNQEVRQKLLMQQFEELGIRIEKDQIYEVVKANPAFANDPNFQNEAGVFDEGKFVQFLAQLKQANPAAYAQWKMQEDALILASMEQSYFNLIKAGVGATLKDGELAYHTESDKVSINFVKVPYTAVADSLIKVSDSEIEAYIKAHEDEFTDEASRDVRYVLFEEKASDADVAEITASLKKLLEPSVVYNQETQTNDTIAGFAGVADVAAFVGANSDLPYSDNFVTKEGLPAAYAEELYRLNEGEVFGPYEDGEYYRLSRMMGKKANASVKASHILLAYDGAQAAPKSPRTKEEAKAKAEELLAQLKANGEDFAKLALEYSDDPGSASRGGTYDNIPQGQMVPAFNDYIFNNAKGALGIVETDFGYHVIRVDDQYEGIQLATISRKVEPSEATSNEIFAETTKFEMAAADGDFEAVAGASTYDVRLASRLKALDELIPGLGNQRGLVQWAFNKDTEVGDVRRFNTPNGYAVVQLTAKRKAGLLRAKDAMARVLPIVRNQKKAAYIIQQNKDKGMAAFAKDNNVSVQAATDLNMKNPIVNGAGREPKVVGVAFGLSQGQTSGLIEGETGVFQVEVTAKSIAPSLDNYATQANALKTLNRGRVFGAAYNALKDAADIEDSRADFY